MSLFSSPSILPLQALSHLQRFLSSSSVLPGCEAEVATLLNAAVYANPPLALPRLLPPLLSSALSALQATAPQGASLTCFAALGPAVAAAAAAGENAAEVIRVSEGP